MTTPTPVTFIGTLSYFCRCGQTITKDTNGHEVKDIVCPKCGVWSSLVVLPRIEPVNNPPIEPGLWIKITKETTVTPVAKRPNRKYVLQEGQIFKIGMDPYDGLDLGNKFCLIEYHTEAKDKTGLIVLLPVPPENLEITEEPTTQPLEKEKKIPIKDKPKDRKEPPKIKRRNP